MPVEFLSDEQADAYGRVPATLARVDAERYWHLDDYDRDLLERRRRDHNRLGFGLQLGALRLTGRFLDDPLAVPVGVVDYVAAQLGVADPSCVKAYGQRPKTVWDHRWEIRREYGYREFGVDADPEFMGWLAARAWTTGDGPKTLFDAAVAWLRGRLVLLPGVTTLARLVATVRDETTERLWATVADLRPGVEARDALGQLVAGGTETRVSGLERLRRGPRWSSGPQLVAALARVAEITQLGVVDVDFSGVPARRVNELARHGYTAHAPILRRLAEPRRTATLLATVAGLHGRAVDDALDVFDDLMTTKLLAGAHRKTDKDRARNYPALAAASAQLAAVVGLLLDHGADDPVAVAQLWREIGAVGSRYDLAAAIATVRTLTPPAGSDLNDAWRAELVGKWRTVQSFIEPLATTITFGATPEGEPVLAALAGLPALLGRHKVNAEEIDTTLLVGSWRRLVLNGPDLEPGTIDRRAWVFCILEQFHRHLLHREIYAPQSNRWRDPRAELLTGAAWTRVRTEVLASLDLPEEPDDHLSDLADALDATYRDVIDRLDDNTIVTFGDDGRLHLHALDALDEPASLVELRALTTAMLPRVDLTDVILEVIGWTALPTAFSSVTGGRIRLDGLDITLAALFTAYGCNIGLGPITQSGSETLNRARLLHVDHNYLRADTIKTANALLIDAQSDLLLAQLRGRGFVAALDGMRFVVPVPSLHARPNPKYFGRRRGATWLNMINDQAAGIAHRVVAGTPRDSLHVIDVLYDQDGGPQPHMIVTDTSSYSDIVFGLMTMAGRLYAPALADIPDTRLWRTDPTANYGPFNTAARHHISLDKIRRHWPDMVRIMGSIHTGAVRAHDVIRMLSRDGRPTALGDAFAHYGRIPKTLHILRLADDDAYRHDIKGMRNLNEGRHAVARKVFHGDEGELRQPYHEGQEDQLGVLGLVLNMIVLFNTRYLSAALEQLRAEGYLLTDEDAARLSPFLHRHIQMRGRYAFERPDLTGPLRPLRDPLDPDNHEPG